MELIDLTFVPGSPPNGHFDVDRKEVKLASPGVKYTGVVYDFRMSSMAGTYIDYPGHIAETDDGQDSLNYSLEKMYRRKATVIHLDRGGDSGAVSAEELQANCPTSIESGGALVLNALGSRQFYEVEERSVWLDKSAVNWMVEQGVELLVSDIYESRDLLGVFYDLFSAGVSTVCCPVNLDKLSKPEVKLTFMPLPGRGITQIPCRVFAEL
jgi:kynurenine formamidase